MTLMHETDQASLESLERHSPTARRALDGYIDAVGASERPDFREHVWRTEVLADIFAKDLIADRVHDTILLHDIAQRAITSKDDTRRTAASYALAEYFTAPELDEAAGRFVATTLGDLVVVESAAEEYRRVFGRATENDELREALTDHKQDALSPELWDINEPPIDIPHLKNICETTNIESIIVKACEALDNMMHPPAREAAILQDILEIETFYAPLCEIMGLDALAMKLRTEATKQRLVHAGHDNAVLLAEHVNTEARRLGPAWALDRMFGNSPTEKVYEVNDATTHAEPIVYGVMKLDEVCGSNHTGTLHYRIKSIGSYAKKIERDGCDELPMDVLGITATVSDPEDISRLFSQLVEQFDTNDAVEFAPAPSKDQALYIQGCPEYTKQIKAQLPPTLIDRIQVKELYGKNGDTDDIYRVCKMTFFVTDGADQMPVELQILTAKDRRKARVGRTAHILFKQQHTTVDHGISYDELAQFLGDINQRKHKADKNGLLINGQSQPHGDGLLTQVTQTVFSNQP